MRGALWPEIDRLIEPNYIEKRLIPVDNLDPMMGGEMPVAYRIGRQRPGRLHGVGDRGMNIRQFGTFMVQRDVVIVDVEII